MESKILDEKSQKVPEKSDEHFAAIVDSPDDAIIGKSLDGRVTSWNRGAEKMFGYTEAEMIGQSVTRLIPTALINDESAFQERITLGKTAQHFETVRRRSNGQLIDVVVSIAPIRDAAGVLIGVSKSVRDITEQKVVEQAFRESEKVLEQRVTLRTAQLEAANKELEAFSYSVSHDLRAPLRSVDSFSRILLEDYGPVLDDEGKRLLNIIRGEAQRMAQLIDDLLAFSRIGRQEMQCAPCDMNALVSDIFAKMDLVRKRSIRVDLKPLSPAHGDHSMLRQVWFNLIANAVKFTGRQRR